jgi:hypothetical protein
MKLRTVGWAVAAIWATGMTLALARIAGTLDSLAARPVAVPPAPTSPGELAISLRTTPSLTAAAAAQPAPDAEKSNAEPPSPEEEAAEQQARDVLAQMVAKGDVDDESIDAMRQAITAMRPEDRLEALGAFAAAASRGEIAAAPDDFRRILP